MRRVLLQSKAFLNGALCEAGSIVEIGDDTALAPYMTELPAEPAPSAPAAVPTAEKNVSVQVHSATGEVDIDVDGVETRIDHATLTIKTD